MNYIQNRTNWCWAVACKIVGENYKEKNPQYHFELPIPRDKSCAKSLSLYQTMVETTVADGIRPEVVPERNGRFLVDAWQRAIVMNANLTIPGAEGNFPGDDDAKIRGLKYILTGDCGSDEVEIANIGTFDMPDTLIALHGGRIKDILKSGRYIIGNTVLFPRGICHSFVLLGWEERRIKVFDPWDGSVRSFAEEDLFERGFDSALGRGAVKWIQYILNRKK